MITTGMDNAAVIVILLGPPGSGKGTQAAQLAGQTGLIAISTGELLRRESQSGSELGRQVQQVLNGGQLVNDDLMNDVVAARLTAGDCCHGCILDGYPRTISQARFLDLWLRQHALQDPTVFDFVVSPEEVIERLSQRRQCPKCGQIYSAEFDIYGKDMLCSVDATPLVRRSDDNPETIRERLRIYESKTNDLVAFYKAGRYFAIEAMQPADTISRQLLSLLNQSLPGQKIVPTVLHHST